MVEYMGQQNKKGQILTDSVGAQYVITEDPVIVKDVDTKRLCKINTTVDLSTVKEMIDSRIINIEMKLDQVKTEMDMCNFNILSELALAVSKSAKYYIYESELNFLKSLRYELGVDLGEV